MIRVQVRKKGKGGEEKSLSEVLKQNSFVPISMEFHQPDSLVSKVFLHPACIREIHQWATESLAEEPVSEVGGFLLGRFQKEKENQYEVSIEVFVPAKEVDYSSPTVLDFGAKALLAVDQALQEYPELEMIGWFHTHPGHTPYLSTMDLRIHDGFYRQPYHVAVVLDSLTPAFDTGIFSRMKQGTVNNKRPNSRWISWKHLLEELP
jgi:proteasome lid subunit RPN8/RPN11